MVRETNLELVLKDAKRYLSTIDSPTEYYFSKANSSIRPQYQGNYKEVAEVFQREFAVTRADDQKPVLATNGIGPCVAMVGYSPKHKVGFLTHYDSMTNLCDSFGFLLHWISQQLDGQSSEFDVRIVCGYTGMSEDIIDFLKSRMNIRKDIQMTLIEEDIGECDGSKNIALDTKTGETFSYDPKRNPNGREITNLEIMMITSGFKSSANLVYAPQRV